MNKCDDIKILELDPKRNLEGSEYMVVAEYAGIVNCIAQRKLVWK